jgi:Tfp pilus assembly protein PilN
VRGELLDLDFAPAARHVQPWGLALLGCGILAVLVGGFVWGEAWSAQAAQAGTLASLDGQQAEADARSARPATVSAGEQARNRATLRVARGLQTPWFDLLSALESAPHDSVALLAIEPSIARQSVRLTAEARDPSAMLDYLAALQADSRLAQVMLVSHQVQAQAPGRPVRFQMQAAWGVSP